MTYENAIKELLKKASDKLTYPVNICVCFFSANYIQFELDDGRKINEILNDKMKNSDDISINWLDNENQINSIKLDDNIITRFRSSDKKLTKKYFNNEQQFIKIDKDGKCRLLLYSLKESLEIEENGFVKQKILDYEKHNYQLESIILPKFEDYIYKSLYVYDNEEAFINAILLQFIMRHVNYNNLAPNKIEISLTRAESLTEEELDFIELIELPKNEREMDIKLENIFGLTYQDVNNLKFMYEKEYHEDLEENIVMELKYKPPHLKTIEINLMDSKEKLIEHIVMLKDNFDRDANLCLNLKERVSEEYLVKANEVLEKFPKSFEKKKDDLIKALFIFDYIQAKKLDIDRLNKEAQEENEMKHNKKDLELINYPKMNPAHSESIFYEIGKLIQEKAGQAKKIHNHIHKFLEQKF
ncbi:hypothetical protein ACN9K5_04315 [Aliarcobacter butzleri]|uniref:Uncharacterized protein n=1 Tax=Aliarcobacter butzleri TaxID=28197 RepID=A0AAW6VS29_9BACT|nr:hypothetical protein [Aliarcobacter butzleri]MCG3669252.1 hypothetical protein [Aliarcobacter butzleri]MCG3676724.1 hypothetical protein [Aliarcobacter butzleri]MCT7630782.1 hypothetical protein [Aliarcobacter butzleri]MCT7639828.1 hypothetical protein [Aliarcobacter butzleri]MDK2063206.1 hypothetical protein [Aliarcobacter butzleri]